MCVEEVCGVDYLKLTQLYESLAATSKRLAKTQILADFFSSQRTYVSHLFYLVQGRIFPDWDERKIGVASRLVIKALCRVTGATEKKISTLLVKYGDLGLVAENAKVKAFSGIVFDLGVSSFMLETPSRGFSFAKEGLLDMRMDSNLEVKASDLVNALNEGELYELFTKLGQEPYARRLARDIVSHRIKKKIV